MLIGIALLSLFSIMMLIWNFGMSHALSQSRELLEEIRDRQKREIARLEERTHALTLQIQLRDRKVPKKAPAPDPAVIKRRVMDAASKAFDEAMRAG